MPGSQILGLRWKAQKRVDLALFVRLCRLDGWVNGPVDILGRIEPHIGCHRGRVYVLARAKALHADALPLIGNAADTFVSEQFEAADMHPRQQSDRRAAIDRDGEGRGEADREIGVTGGDRRGRGKACWRRQAHVADIGETLGPQQLIGDILRGNANARAVGENTYGGRFGRAFHGQRLRCADECYGARQRHSGEEMASAQHHRHWKPPYPSASMPSARV
jgi:hypothetical protein